MSQTKVKGGFLGGVTDFFKRVSNSDTIKIGDRGITTFSQPQSTEELDKRKSLQVFRQYIQQKNWNVKHIELFDEYRRMDMTYPIIAAALSVYIQEICISGDTVVGTPAGDLTVRELYEKKKTLFYVKSFDVKNNRVEWNMVKGIKSNGIKPVFKITVLKQVDTDNLEWDFKQEASFKCTDNHKILVNPKELNENKRFKQLKDLKVGDVIWSMYYWKDPACKCMKPYYNQTVIQNIEPVGEEEVFDLIDVSPNNHFIIKLTDSFYVTVHNCTKDTDGNVIEIVTENKKVKKLLEECFYDNLKLNTTSYLHVKAMLKFGNHYAWLETRQGEGVVDMISLPPEAIRIQLQQQSSRIDEFKYQWWGSGSGQMFEPWEIVHWRNMNDLEMEPYGQSILRPVVDTYRRIILMREALIIYRITRAPQRLLFKIDTTGLDADGALRVADDMKKQLYRKPLINPITGDIDYKNSQLSIQDNLYLPTFDGDQSDVKTLDGATNLSDVEDYKIIKDDLYAGLMVPNAFLNFEDSLCGFPETEISMLNGIDKTFLNLADDYKNGVQNYVYSTDEKGDIKPGKVIWAGKTKTVKSYYNITLDNGKSVRMTDNHPWMMRDGSYRRSDELQIGDSLMPLYRRTSKNKGIDGKDHLGGYDMVWHNATGKWEYTHRMVALHENPAGYKQDGNGRRVVHHIDGNKMNNHPDNLRFMNQSEHIAEHREIAIQNLCSPETGYRQSLDFAPAPFNHKVAKIEIIYEECEMYDITVDKYHNFALSAGVFVHNCLRQDTVILTNEGAMTIKQVTDLYFNKPSKKIYSLSCNKYGIIASGRIRNAWATKEVSSLHRITINNDKIIECTPNHPFMMKDLNYKSADLLEIGDVINNIYNIDMIITGVEIIDLDELEWVYDLEIEEYHNFALECGIFVHNSNKAALAQEDIRFSNAVRQYQSHYIEGLIHIALVHLFTNGCSQDEMGSFEIRMNSNSQLAEKMKNEILLQRFALAKEAWSTDNTGFNFMSFTQVLKEILHFTDEEVQRSIEQQLIEKKMAWRMVKLSEDGTYQDPNPEFKDMIGMKSQADIFANLNFESKNVQVGIRSILNEQIDRELKELLAPKFKPSNKKIAMIVNSRRGMDSKMVRNIINTRIDLGVD